MHLSQAITKAQSIAELNDIFARDISVTLSCMNDVVEVEGYERSISTDFIARKIIGSFFNMEEDEQSKQLAATLAAKVFTPLKKLVESPKNRYSCYQLFALTRISWTPSPAAEFGCSIALKHAMVLGCLDLRYRESW